MVMYFSEVVSDSEGIKVISSIESGENYLVTYDNLEYFI
jgi:hypothetical protein